MTVRWTNVPTIAADSGRNLPVINSVAGKSTGPYTAYMYSRSGNSIMQLLTNS